MYVSLSTSELRVGLACCEPLLTVCGSLMLFLSCLVTLSCASVCARLFIDALWSPAGKGLTSWFSFVMSNCEVVTFPCGILGQVWCLIVLIPDLCPFSYFVLIFVGSSMKKYDAAC